MIAPGVDRSLVLEVRNPDHMAFAGAVRGVLRQMDQFVCGLAGHEELMRFEPDRLSLHCSWCGHQSTGWQVRAPRMVI